jgi:hypothetical protein
MTGIEKWIFQADEHQQSAIKRLTGVSGQWQVKVKKLPFYFHH